MGNYPNHHKAPRTPTKNENNSTHTTPHQSSSPQHHHRSHPREHRNHRNQRHHNPNQNPKTNQPQKHPNPHKNHARDQRRSAGAGDDTNTTQRPPTKNHTRRPSETKDDPTAGPKRATSGQGVPAGQRAPAHAATVQVTSAAGAGAGLAFFFRHGGRKKKARPAYGPCAAGFARYNETPRGE